VATRHYRHHRDLLVPCFRFLFPQDLTPRTSSWREKEREKEGGTQFVVPCSCSLKSLGNTHRCSQIVLQPIAIGVSFILNLQSESHSSLFDGTWQKRPRELDYRLRFENVCVFVLKESLSSVHVLQSLMILTVNSHGTTTLHRVFIIGERSDAHPRQSQKTHEHNTFHPVIYTHTHIHFHVCVLLFQPNSLLHLPSTRYECKCVCVCVCVCVYECECIYVHAYLYSYV